MKIKHSFVSALACFSALIICCCMFVSAKAQSQQETVIPSLTDVQNTGYPINATGERQRLIATIPCMLLILEQLP